MKEGHESLTAIETQGLTRKFGEDTGIFDIHLSVKWGTVTSLIGANGSGKSTCLRCLSLFEGIDAGSVRIGDRLHLDANSTGSRDGAGEQIDSVRGAYLGLVFQNYELWPHLSVWDNLALALDKTQRLSKTEVNARVEAALNDFAVLDRAKSMPYKLSGGMRQRAAIAKALVLQPKVLLLDEVTSGLDPEWTETIRQRIRRFADDGGAVVNVAHQLGFVRRLSDEVVFLDRGRVVERGKPEVVLANPESERLRLFVENS